VSADPGIGVMPASAPDELSTRRRAASGRRARRGSAVRPPG